MARPVDEILPKESTDIAQHLRIARGMQPVAAVVHRLPGQIEAAGVSSHRVTPLDYRHPGAAAPGESIGAAEAGGTGAQDDDAGHA